MSGKCLVGTNVIIRLLRADEHSIALFDQADIICIPVIVAGELFYGAQKSTQKQENKAIFSNFLSHYEVVEVDLPIAQAYGDIKAQQKKDGITIPENDLWIAATAKANQYTLITYDGHFSKINDLQILS
jgi:predicted nucleic acid-binding protein